MFLSNLFKFDLLVHITFLFGILFFFFFLVGIKEERKGLANSIKSNINKMIVNNNQIKILRNDYHNLNPNLQKQLKEQVIENLQNKNLLMPDSNIWFLILGIIILITLVSASIYYAFYLHQKKGIKKSILLAKVYNTLILFIVIGCIEVMFFFLVILKYQPILNTEINEAFIRRYNQDIPV